MFNYLLQSDFVNSNYERVRQDEEIAGTARHDLSHIQNVINLVESVLTQLNQDEEYIEAAKIAALFHDLGCIHGKKGHALNSYLMVNEYLDINKIKLKYQEEILDAIKNHGSSFDSQSLMTLTLIMCDKIDLKKIRLAPEGYETIGIRQLQFISDIKVTIQNDECLIEFKSTPELDFEELNSFDFLDKTFKSIHAFAKYNNLEPVIKMNGAKWHRIL